MFKKNDVLSEQLNLFSIEDNWSNYQKQRIKDSWVGYFHDNIFPVIDEAPYCVLYSNNVASCPNTPVNVLVSLLIIKTLTDKTDEEIIDSLLFDQRIQYAVHTLNADRQHISKNMLGNFRRKMIDYEAISGINLFENTMRQLNDVILGLYYLDKNIEKIDPMKISSYCKKMSQIELVYTTNYNFVKYLKILDKVPTKFEYYLNEKYKNEMVYKTKNVETNDKMKGLFASSLELYDEFKNDEIVSESSEFRQLKKLVNDQCIII